MVETERDEEKRKGGEKDGDETERNSGLELSEPQSPVDPETTSVSLINCKLTPISLSGSDVNALQLNNRSLTLALNVLIKSLHNCAPISRSQSKVQCEIIHFNELPLSGGLGAAGPRRFGLTQSVFLSHF